MAKIDYETILTEIKSIISSNYNTKLTEIDAEKSDFTLPTVDSNAYQLQSMNEKVLNYDPFILYGITSVETESNGPQISERIRMELWIIKADQNENNINEMMFRYLRAFKEIFEENWQINNISTKINVNNATVLPLESLNSSESYKAVAIEIEVYLA